MTSAEFNVVWVFLNEIPTVAEKLPNLFVASCNFSTSLMGFFYCFYCLDSRGYPMKHDGAFMHVPKKHTFIWRKSLESTLHRHIDDETWNSWLK